MEGFDVVAQVFDQLEIDYQVVEHPAVQTTAAAQVYMQGIDDVGTTKTLFLTDKKKRRFYLVTMEGNKTIDLATFAKLVGEKKLKFVSAELLADRLHQIPGAVWFFGLRHDTDQMIQCYLDRELIEPGILRLPFQPNDPTKTLIISPKDVLTFLEAIGHPYQLVDF